MFTFKCVNFGGELEPWKWFESDIFDRELDMGMGRLACLTLPLLVCVAEYLLKLLLSSLFREELGYEVVVGLGLLCMSFVGGVKLYFEGGIMV